MAIVLSRNIFPLPVPRMMQFTNKLTEAPQVKVNSGDLDLVFERDHTVKSSVFS